LAPGRDVGEAGFVGEGGDEFVTAAGEVGGDAGFGFGKGREEKQATSSEGGLPLRRNAFGQGSRRAEDDGLGAAQEDAETFPLHRRVEAADDAAAIVAPMRGLVVSAKDGATWTAGGTKERGLRLGEQFEIPEGGQSGWSLTS